MCKDLISTCACKIACKNGKGAGKCEARVGYTFTSVCEDGTTFIIHIPDEHVDLFELLSTFELFLRGRGFNYDGKVGIEGEDV